MSIVKISSINLVKHGRASEAFKVFESNLPEPSEAEALIEVEASGINFAEVLARKGLYPEAPKLPFVPGYEIIGRILKLGASHKHLKVGDRVVAGTRFGGYASHVNARIDRLRIVPEDLDAAVALSLVTQGATAWIATNEVTKIYQDDLVLVHSAAGGVGNIIVQLAKRNGAKVFGLSSTAEKIRHLETMGVDYPINYLKNNYPEEIKNILGQKKRLDVVFDSLGGKHLKTSGKLIGAGGRIVSLGFADIVSNNRPSLSLLKLLLNTQKINPLQLMAKSQSIAGINVLKLLDYKNERVTSAFDEVLKLTLSGELVHIPGQVFARSEIGDAHELLENRGHLGKIIIKW